jgi:hypothetical protein
MSWDSPSWTDLILVIFGYLLLAPRNHAQRIIYAIFSVIAYFYDPTEPMIRMIIGTYDTVLKYRIHELVAQHFRTVLTLSAIVWYVSCLQAPPARSLTDSRLDNSCPPKAAVSWKLFFTDAYISPGSFTDRY